MMYLDKLMSSGIKIPKPKLRLASHEKDKGLNIIYLSDNAPLYSYLEKQLPNLIGDIYVPNLLGTILGKKIVNTKYYTEFKNNQPKFKINKIFKVSASNSQKTNIFDMSHFSADILDLLNSKNQKMIFEKIQVIFSSILKDFKKNNKNNSYLMINFDGTNDIGGYHFIQLFDYLSQLNGNKIRTDFNGIFYVVDDIYYPVAIKSDSRKYDDELTFVRTNLKLIAKQIEGSIVIDESKLDKLESISSNISNDDDSNIKIDNIFNDSKNKKNEQLINDIKDLQKTINSKNSSNTEEILQKNNDLSNMDKLNRLLHQYKHLNGLNVSNDEVIEKYLKLDNSNIKKKEDDIQSEYQGVTDVTVTKGMNQNRVFNPNQITGITQLNGYNRQKTEFKDHIDHELEDMFMNFEADPQLNIKVLNFKASKIIDDSKNRYKEYSVKLQHKDFGKTFNRPYTIKFKVPVPQNDKYFKLNGQQYILINQIYPKPIIKVNQDLVRLHTMHTNTAAFELKKSKLENSSYNYIERDFMIELLKNSKNKAVALKNDEKDDIIEKYNLPLDFVNFHYKTINLSYGKDIIYRANFDFSQNKFFEQYKGTLKDKELIRYATYNNSENELTYFDQGIIKKYPKDKLNDFVMRIYDDISKDNYGVGILNKNKSAKPYYSIRLLKTNIPVFQVLIFWLGFKEAAKRLNIKYTIGKKTNLCIPLDDGSYLNFNPSTQKQEYMINGLLLNKLKLKKSLISNNSKEILDEHYAKWLGPYKTQQLKELELKIIDKSTAKILGSLNYPDDIKELLINTLPDMLLNRNTKNHNDLDNYRIRMSETITHKLFEQMNQSVGLLKKRKNTNDAKLDIHPNFLNQYLSSTGIIQNTFSINPLEELNISMKTTKSGVGNSLKSQITLEKRDLNPTFFGTIAPTATNEYGSIGLTQTLTNGHLIKDKFGNVDIKNFNNKGNPFNNLSAIESLTAFLDRNDTTRVVMGNQQTNQVLQLQNPDEALVQTGYESFIQQICSDRFSKKSPVDGIVKKIENDKIYIEDKHKKISIINCKTVKSRNKRGIYLPLNYNIKAKVGQKLKENDILALSDSLKSGKLAIGKNLNVAIMGYLGANYEDGWAISEEATKKYNVKLYKKLQIRIPENVEILDYNISKKNTEVGDLLLSFKKTSTYDMEDLSDFETDGESLISLDSRDNISKFYSPGGEIKDIVIKINSTSSKLLKNKHKENIKELEELTKECALKSEGSDKDGYDSDYYSCIGQYENSDQIQIGGHKVRGNEFRGALIEIYVEFDHEVMNGSKFTLGNTGAKGTVQYIIPKDKRPIATKSGIKIDFIPTPVSIIGRKNPGILYTLYLGKIVYYLNKAVIELNKSGKINQIKKIVFEVFSFLDKTEKRIILKDLENFFKSSNTIISKTINNSDPLNKPAFPAIVQPFMNKLTMQDIQGAANALGIPLNETVKYVENGNIISKKEVPVGILNVHLLEHIPKYMGSVRGSLNNNYALTTGQGRSGTKEGDGASQLGLYDLYSLLTFRPYGLIKELHSLKSDNHRGRTKMNNQIIHNEGYPDLDDIPIEEEDNVSKNMAKFLFLGSGLRPNF